MLFWHGKFAVNFLTASGTVFGLPHGLSSVFLTAAFMGGLKFASSLFSKLCPFLIFNIF